MAKVSIYRLKSVWDGPTISREREIKRYTVPADERHAIIPLDKSWNMAETISNVWDMDSDDVASLAHEFFSDDEIPCIDDASFVMCDGMSLNDTIYACLRAYDAEKAASHSDITNARVSVSDDGLHAQKTREYYNKSGKVAGIVVNVWFEDTSTDENGNETVTRTDEHTFTLAYRGGRFVERTYGISAVYHMLERGIAAYAADEVKQFRAIVGVRATRKYTFENLGDGIANQTRA